MGSPEVKIPDGSGQTTGKEPEPKSLEERPTSAADWRKKDLYFRRLYATNPDFQDLAKTDASFAAVLKSNGQLDFSDPAAFMQLTKTLLKRHYDLIIELPDDRLCPPVPNRHNYILWLKDLMDSTSRAQPGEKLLGLDIGTGASCIYPLLGTAQRDWHFVGTDIDSKSLAFAQKNVDRNNLQAKIRLLKREPSDPLLPLADLHAHHESLDFVMTNPPFYASDEEMITAAAAKARPPNTACTGAPNEMICAGGETAFVGRLLEESLQARETVGWYTCMLGKARSVEHLVGKLREANIDNYAVSDLVQGNKTRRWALGWSFRPLRPSESAARGRGLRRSAGWKKVLPPAVETELLRLEAESDVGPGPLIAKIKETIAPLDLMSWSWDEALSEGIGRASENVWSRAWRRRKKKEQFEAEAREKTSKPAESESSEAASRHDTKSCRFGFIVLVRAETKRLSVTLRWLEGHDAVLFETFRVLLQGALKEFKEAAAVKS